MKYRVEMIVEDEPWEEELEEEPMAYILYVLQSAIDGSPELRLVEYDIEPDED